MTLPTWGSKPTRRSRPSGDNLSMAEDAMLNWLTAHAGRLRRLTGAHPFALDLARCGRSD